MNIDMKTIGSRIKERRIELDLTQTQIKKAVGISSGNLSEIENGNRTPSMQTLYRLSKILNCTIDWIVKGESSLSENDVFSFAGDEATLLKYFKELPKDDQEELLMIAEMKVNKRKKMDVKSSPSGENNTSSATA